MKGGTPAPYLGGDGYAPGFGPDTVYQTYDDYANDADQYQRGRTAE